MRGPTEPYYQEGLTHESEPLARDSETGANRTNRVAHEMWSSSCRPWPRAMCWRAPYPAGARRRDAFKPERRAPRPAVLDFTERPSSTLRKLSPTALSNNVYKRRVRKSGIGLPSAAKESRRYCRAVTSETSSASAISSKECPASSMSRARSILACFRS